MFSVFSVPNRGKDTVDGGLSRASQSESGLRASFLNQILPKVLDFRLSFEPVLLSVFSFIVITRRISFSPFLLSFELLPPIFDLIIILKYKFEHSLCQGTRDGFRPQSAFGISFKVPFWFDIGFFGTTPPP